MISTTTQQLSNTTNEAPQQALSQTLRQIKVKCSAQVEGTQSCEIPVTIQPEMSISDFISTLQDHINSLPPSTNNPSTRFQPADISCITSFIPVVGGKNTFALDSKLEDFLNSPTFTTDPNSEIEFEVVTEQEFQQISELAQTPRYDVLKEKLKEQIQLQNQHHEQHKQQKQRQHHQRKSPTKPTITPVTTTTTATATATAPLDLNTTTNNDSTSVIIEESGLTSPATKKSKRGTMVDGDEEKPEGHIEVTKTGQRIIYNMSCHRCKTRKARCFLCPKNDKHKFCSGCLERHHKTAEMPSVGCPICTHECSCAVCRKKNELQ